MTYKSHYGIDYDRLEARCKELAATIPEDVGRFRVYRQADANSDHVLVVFTLKNRTQATFQISVHEWIYDFQQQPLDLQFSGYLLPIAFEFIDIFHEEVPFDESLLTKL